MVNKAIYRLHQRVRVISGPTEGAIGRIVYVREVGHNPDNWDYSVQYEQGGGHWHYGNKLQAV